MKEVIERLLTKNFEDSTEIGKAKRLSCDLRAYTTGEGYDEVLKELFKDEREEHEKIFNWRIKNSHPQTAKLLNINNEIASLVGKQRPQQFNIDSEVLTAYFNEFYGEGSIADYANKLVNEHAYESPFDFLLIDVTKQTERSESPIIKPKIIPISSVLFIDYDCGNIQNFCFETDNNGVAFYNKTHRIEIRESKQNKKNLIEDINYDNGVYVIAHNDKNYEIIVTNIGEDLHVMQIGFVKTPGLPLLKGNEFSPFTYLLREIARLSSNASTRSKLSLKPRRYKVVESVGDKETTEKEEMPLSSGSSLAGVTEIEIASIEDSIKDGNLDSIKGLEWEETPNLTVLEAIDKRLDSSCKELEQSIIGTELHNKEELIGTATANRIKKDRKVDAASVRIRQMERLVHFIFNSIKDICLKSKANGVKEDAKLTFNYSQNLDGNTLADNIELMNKAQGMPVAVQDIVRKRLILSATNSDTEILKVEEVWGCISPLYNKTAEEVDSLFSSYSSDADLPIYQEWHFILQHNIKQVKALVQNIDSFYDTPLNKQIEKVKELVDGLQ